MNRPLVALSALAFCPLLALHAADSSIPVSVQRTETRPADIFVDPAGGNDSNSGRDKPVKSIARAISLAQAGDAIHLAPGIYFQSADFVNKHGTPEAPIILDGHGATLDGSEAVRTVDWENLGHGLYRKVKLLPKIDPMRWYFIWDGKMNHMGRTSKGPKAPFKPAEDLIPGEWTYVQEEEACYIRVEEKQDLDAAKIRYPARANGVAMSGKGSNIVVRNVRATHVYNDGFNVHGAQRNLRFENIASIDCGDDGFSAHEDAECSIDGFVSIGNSTGLCDINSSVTHYKNVYIRDCLGYDIYFLGDSVHTMENVWVESSAFRTLEVAQTASQRENSQGALSDVTLKNGLIRRSSNTPGSAYVSKHGKLALEHCTFTDLNFTTGAGAEVHIKSTVMDGTQYPVLQIAAESVWKGRGNAYSLSAVKLGSKKFGAGEFEEFRAAIASEQDSVWGPAKSGMGADLAGLESLKKHWKDAVEQ